MKPGFEARLRNAVAEVERSDRDLAGELREVRAERGRAATERLAPALESFGVAPAIEAGGLTRETIVLRTGRPVLAVVNDQVRLDWSDAESEVWRERLTKAREPIGQAIRAVGRIEVENHSLDWVGTGWLIAPDVIVTNRHVASEFASRRGEGFVFRQGFGGRVSARIDFLEELGQTDERQFEIERILHVEADDGPDVALLQVQQKSGDSLADPIRTTTRTALANQQVAVIGYPARDSRIPEQDLMLRIFGDVFDKKRLAPGQVKAMSGGFVVHDCSTLGGNSGSVVLDLASGEAVALHFSGRFLEGNFAVPAQTIAEILRSHGRAASRPSPPPSHRDRRAGPVDASARSVTVTIPLRIRVEVGAPEVDDGGSEPGLHARPAPSPSPEDDDGDLDAVEEGRPEDYADREGYVESFLGPSVGLPEVLDDGDVLTFRVDGKKERVLRYEHFSVVMSRSRRLCRFSAVNVDGRHSGKATRTAWRLDPRLEREQQIVKECYGNPPKLARGHMTRREDPIWGTPAAAARGNSDSMHVTNAVPQMQPFNAGVWLGLEDYALQNARQDDMKISVITGPVLRDDDPVLFGVQIPVTFWKLIAFLHDETGDLCATAYTMSQQGFLREEELVFGRHETAQVPVAVVEAMAGLAFPSDLRRLDPLERVAESRPTPLYEVRQIRFR